MQVKLINISDAEVIPVPRDITPEEEAVVVADYKSARTLAALEADYQNMDKQLADGIPAEQLLQELTEDSVGE
jgi:hypothetical protein